MGHAEWARVAGDIVGNYDEFDAFVVLHGTDTMAYTASALSFMLENRTFCGDVFDGDSCQYLATPTALSLTRVRALSCDASFRSHVSHLFPLSLSQSAKLSSSPARNPAGPST